MTISATQIVATPVTNSFGFKLPPVQMNALRRDATGSDWEQRHYGTEVKGGWQGIASHQNWSNGGTVVSEQAPTPGTVAKVERWFGTFYGATTRMNVILGAEVLNLGSGVSEARAKQAGSQMARNAGSPSLALVREGANLVLREALSPVIGSPYVKAKAGEPGWRGGISGWGALRLDNQQTDTSGGWGDLGLVDRVRFATPALRALFDGAEMIANASPENVSA